MCNVYDNVMCMIMNKYVTDEYVGFDSKWL